MPDAAALALTGARPGETAGSALACFHCGQPVPQTAASRTVLIDGIRRPMCCAGCEAVASAIVEGGLSDYYRHRASPAARPDGLPAELAARLAVYDDPDVQRDCVRARDGDTRDVTLLVDDLRCGACVWLIERTLRAEPGVTTASANLSSGRLTLAWSPAATRLSALIGRLATIGYHAMPFDAQADETRRAAAQRGLLRRLFVAGLGMMQVMMYAVPVYLSGPDDFEPWHLTLMRWASLVLTLPVVFYSAMPFFAGAWRDLRNRRPGMDVPVAIGVAAAFAASVVATVADRGEVWFDTVTMFVFLLLTARWLERGIGLRAGRRIDRLAAALPDTVSRCLPDGTFEQVPARRARVGDHLLVGRGEAFALDARLLDGHARVDQAMLTGESRPIAFAPGARIAGGSLNVGDPVRVEVLAGVDESAGSLIRHLTDRAAADKPRVALAADRVAAVFVAALLALAALVFAGWWLVDPDRALPTAIAVLVVSCPCALSLATPAALAAAGGRLLGDGLLVTQGSALEALAGVTDVVFDKTGTLTIGRPRVVDVVPAAGTGPVPSRADLLAVAAALEAGSHHPYARALVEAAGSDAVTPADELRNEPGRGVAGTVGGARYRLGSAAWAGVAEPPADPGGDSDVWLAVERPGAPDGPPVTAPLARFVLRDALQSGAAELVGALQRSGITVHLASGDQPGAVVHCAKALGIASARGRLLPDDKLALVRDLQRQGRRVLMVGDGVNDAPVLAAADVSIAVADASALARVSADLVSLRGGLAPVTRAIDTAHAARRVIRQNLAWATVYNAVAIPAAALGFVPPWAAAAGMSISSLAVAANAARLLGR